MPIESQHTDTSITNETNMNTDAAIVKLVWYGSGFLIGWMLSSSSQLHSLSFTGLFSSLFLNAGILLLCFVKNLPCMLPSIKNELFIKINSRMNIEQYMLFELYYLQVEMMALIQIRSRSLAQTLKTGNGQ